ncbi:MULTISPECIES: GNAT family N-acetyltransferase [unclassified Psychrobacter]|uniref:GNAT family N-acetyltransferase n=1 Tax=unclassified Psychrobacter TaxID=196806 RepID=UPI0025B2EF5E|nr:MULTISPECIES: GNAT family N-acetyltransferase [unclassified Psychrobacter]MDN3452144.1 GNAT family N-acetyltransferase [Psychrobacter sp. APC 3350]MDN3502373.1 GNAT family N-acetyltransferase [Psychrobacter sp. 5A.1]
MSNQNAVKDNTVKELDIIHDKKTKRFETSIDSQTGYISYQESGEKLVYDHTIVPQQLGGRGVGSALVKHALNYAREQGKKVVPQCSFVASYISRHPEYQDLI